MNELLPWVFVVLAGVALAAGFAALWMSLRQLFTPAPQTTVRRLSESRDALMAEKAALLQEIQDLAFEHESGKLSDHDYDRLNEKMRNKAKNILAQLDEDIAPFRQQALDMVSSAGGRAHKDAP